MNKVVMVTVTYNSSDLLSKLVDAVQDQDYPVDRIIVVDNASNGEHKERLSELCRSTNKVQLLTLKENIGGAGGFYTGMKYALDNISDCDWIWLMDDDAYPEKDTLSTLLRYKELPDIGALCPMITGIESGRLQLYHHKKENRYLNRDEMAVNSADELEEVTPIQANSFVGPLMNIDVIKDVGLPDPELFIEGDDTEYTLRISRKYKLYLIKKAKVYHRDINRDDNYINPLGIWKMYYLYRNRFIIISRNAKSGYNRRTGKALLCKNACGMISHIMLEKKYSEVRDELIKLIQKAVRDGLKNKTGKTIDPSEYNKRFM